MLTRDDIAKMIGVTPETFRRRVEPHPDFPKPALRLSRKTVRWELADIRRWLDMQKQRA